MGGSTESAFRFLDFRSGEPPREGALGALADSVVRASSRGLGWDGVVVDRAASGRCEGQPLAVTGHWVGLNLRGRLAIDTVTVERGCFVILPAGAAFNLKNRPSDWGAVEVSVDKVRRVLGNDLHVVPRHGLSDEPLAAVVRALLAEAATGGAAGRPYFEALVLALIARLAGLFDAGSAPAETLDGRRLAATCALVDARLGKRITVKSLAHGTGLSPAHFSREFKRTTGETPHAFVMRRRLEHAHGFLADGGSIAEAALCSGFADQAHLSRLFKQRYFVTPGAFVRGLQ
jgi:AraC-like DNA-binding protein